MPECKPHIAFGIDGWRCSTRGAGGKGLGGGFGHDSRGCEEE